MKQTAIDWLIEELGEYFPNYIGGIELLVNQAKEMEKEQIVAAYIKGQSDCEMFTMQSEAEQYYKENYETI